MSIWFSSDAHFGHDNIRHHCNRPFESVQSMDNVLIGNWNALVFPDDLVYYLGDFSLNPYVMKKVLPRLNGRKILIAGNHDKCWPKKDKSGKWKQFYIDAGFEQVYEMLMIIIADRPVLLSHLPYRNPNDPDQRYFDERPLDDGGWLIHGHTHNPCKVNGKMIHVGVDAHDYFPVRLEAIEETIRGGKHG